MTGASTYRHSRLGPVGSYVSGNPLCARPVVEGDPSTRPLASVPTSSAKPWSTCRRAGLVGVPVGLIGPAITVGPAQALPIGHDCGPGQQGGPSVDLLGAGSPTFARTACASSLRALEQHRRERGRLYEALPLPSGLEVENVMPHGWRQHGHPEPGLDPGSADRRDRPDRQHPGQPHPRHEVAQRGAVEPATDRTEASALKQGGRPGADKRAPLRDVSLLVLNKPILKGHEAAWIEQDMGTVSVTQLSICAVWIGPKAGVTPSAL